MIERLLAADAALDRDELDVAQRLFAQVADADPRNAIAVVGLARVAVRRNAAGVARSLALRALDIDPEEAAARRLLDELEAGAESGAAAVATPVTVAPPAVAAPTVVAAPAVASTGPVAAAAPAVAAPAVVAARLRAKRRSWWRRILGRFLRRR